MAFTDYNKCSLLLPMDGSNNGTTFTDWSPNPRTITVNGNTKTSTVQSKYYGSSGYFDGSGDKLTITRMPANSELFSDLNNPFTIEFWIYITGRNTASNYPIIFSAEQSPTYRYSIFYTGVSPVINFTSFINNSGQYVSVGVVPMNTWTHIAFVNEGGRFFKAYKNGVFVSSLTMTQSLEIGATLNYSIGDGISGLDGTQGYIQDFQIRTDAYYLSNFTPPTRLIGEISGNVKDINGANASRIITAIPRSNPTRSFSTISDAGTGNYTLRCPATEVSRIALANETSLYNDIVDRIIPE